MSLSGAFFVWDPKLVRLIKTLILCRNPLETFWMSNSFRNAAAGNGEDFPAGRFALCLNC